MDIIPLFCNSGGPIEYIGCNLLCIFCNFIDNKNKNVLAQLNKYCSNIFGINLHMNTYLILKDIQDKGWKIKIQIQNNILTHLYMCLENPYSEKSIECTIPDEICQLITLKELVIRRGINGEIIGGLPENIGNLINLEYLDIRISSIISKFPFSMIKMHNLHSLDLRGTKIIENIPREWFWHRNGPEDKAARIIQNMWRGKDLQEGIDIEYKDELRGPLRFKDSQIDIWERTDYSGYSRSYVGSILDMSDNDKITPYIWIKYDSILGEEKKGDWVRPPLLKRANAMCRKKMWYGIIYV